MTLNKALLIGNVGDDPTIHTFNDGNKIANFSLATSETYTNKEGEKVTNTEWHNIVVKSKLVDVVENWVKKGQQLYVEGAIRTRQWEDENGEKKYTTEIVLSGFDSKLKMLGKKDSSSTFS